MPRKRRKLTPRARTRLVFVTLVELCEIHRWWPSKVEIAKRIGERAGSLASVWRSLDAMASDGLVKMRREQARRVSWSATNEGFKVFQISPVAARFPCRPRRKTHKQKLAETKRTRLAVLRILVLPELTGDEAPGSRSFQETLRNARLEASRRTPDDEPGDDDGASFVEPPVQPKPRATPRIPPWMLNDPGEDSGGLPIVAG